MDTPSLSSITRIPISRPSCGSISLAQPEQACPQTTEPHGCFLQQSGFFCAPLASTRGFLYTLGSPSLNYLLHPRIRLIPELYIPPLPTTGPTTAVDDDGGDVAAGRNGSMVPLVGVDGEPVRYGQPGRLGQNCTGIPLPSSTSGSSSSENLEKTMEVLFAMANQRLKEALGHDPGVGAGARVLDLRGDCEPSSYCDRSASGNGRSEEKGVCREQYPDFHGCSSYLQCISLRCGPVKDEGGGQSRRTRRGLDRRRRGGNICLPGKGMGYRRLQPGSDPLAMPGHAEGDHGAGGSSRSSSSSSSDEEGGRNERFPAWAGGVLAVLFILGVSAVFVLNRRRKTSKTRMGMNVNMDMDRIRSARMREQSRGDRGASLDESWIEQDIKVKGSSLGSSQRWPKLGQWFTGKSIAPSNDRITANDDLPLPVLQLVLLKEPSQEQDRHEPVIPILPATSTSTLPISSSPLSGTENKFQKGEILLRQSTPKATVPLSPPSTSSSSSSSSPRASSGSRTLVPPSPAPSSSPISIPPICPVSPGRGSMGSSRLSNRMNTPQAPSRSKASSSLRVSTPTFHSKPSSKE